MFTTEGNRDTGTRERPFRHDTYSRIHGKPNGIHAFSKDPRDSWNDQRAMLFNNGDMKVFLNSES
jgi:hypothetical protein